MIIACLNGNASPSPTCGCPFCVSMRSPLFPTGEQIKFSGDTHPDAMSLKEEILKARATHPHQVQGSALTIITVLKEVLPEDDLKTVLLQTLQDGKYLGRYDFLAIAREMITEIRRRHP